jgi:triosephosphate isomerase
LAGLRPEELRRLGFSWQKGRAMIELARSITALRRQKGVEVAVLPPFVHLHALAEVLAGSGVALGAQDCFWEQRGPFTGEVSPRMLAGWCDLVLVGHSERRARGETDEQTARKLRAALSAGLKVIVAVGELLEDRRAGRHADVVSGQVSAALGGLDEADLLRVVVAYEPVWAIGTGRTATPEQAQQVHGAIREALADRFSRRAAEEIRILYGGSVTPENIDSLIAKPDIDGALVGGASLKAASFVPIVRAVSSSAKVN